MNLQDLLHMGGYAQFVWTSYAIAFAVIVGNVWGALRMRAAAREKALRRTEIAATRGTTGISNELSKEGV
jgi:heme exporter protein CcmD